VKGVAACEIPHASFLDAYRLAGAYADCFVADIARPVSQAQYVEAFYTTGLFRIERLILAVAISRPSTDDEARKLSVGESDSFAAWHVESRSQGELLLAAGRTRSWLMAVARPSREGTSTRLYFGSAIVPEKKPRKGQDPLGRRFRILLGFHRLYSRALLRAALSRLEAPSA
jgi:hypothetical protein